jgi:hypothetical protein
LRSYPKGENFATRDVDNGPPRHSIDLSFLKIPSDKPEDREAFYIHEAAISLVVCGSDNWRWVAYAFIDTNAISDNDNLSEEVESHGDFRGDPIASEPGLEVNANDPIWDPREYFLMILEIRIRQVLREWQYLVRRVECSIKQYVGSRLIPEKSHGHLLITRQRKRHPFTLSQRSRNKGGRVKDVKKAFDWTQQAIELLSQLLDVLSETIKAWDMFKSPNGDIGYFTDASTLPNTQKSPLHLSFHSIQETFEQLECLYRQLLKLDKSCKNSAQTVSRTRPY